MPVGKKRKADLPVHNLEKAQKKQNKKFTEQVADSEEESKDDDQEMIEVDAQYDGGVEEDARLANEGEAILAKI